MSEVRGKIITCERCGAKIFVKTIGDGESDGGFTRWNKFEESPGWGHDCRVGIDLCPECRKELDLLCGNFTKNKNSNKNLVLDIINASKVHNEIVGDAGKEELIDCLIVSKEELNKIAKKHGVFIWEAMNNE